MEAVHSLLTSSVADPELIIFSSYLPSYEDFMLLYLTPIRTVYYLGDVEDPKTVQFLNSHTQAGPEQGFKLINLKF